MTQPRFKEYDLEVPQVALDLGFDDRSYCNDTAARMRNEQLNMDLWVSEDDPEQREFSDMKKFTLFVTEDFDNGAQLFETDDPEELRQYVAQVIADSKK